MDLFARIREGNPSLPGEYSAPKTNSKFAFFVAPDSRKLDLSASAKNSYELG
jgi:hypothetical protein